jgi:predicted dehydrogenase
VLGDRGALRLQMPPGANKTIWHDEATSQGVISHLIWQGDEPGGSDHVHVLEDFARAVRENRAPRTSLEQALLVQRITDAIYASAERGAAVEIV